MRIRTVLTDLDSQYFVGFRSRHILPNPDLTHGNRIRKKNAEIFLQKIFHMHCMFVHYQNELTNISSDPEVVRSWIRPGSTTIILLTTPPPHPPHGRLLKIRLLYSNILTLYFQSDRITRALPAPSPPIPSPSQYRSPFLFHSPSPLRRVPA